VPTAGASAQTLADPGYYVAVAGASSETIDPVGTFSGAGASVATQASPGSYVPTTGASAAILASPGHYVPTAGASAQLLADPGYYVAVAGATAEIAAQPGYYVPNAGASAEIAVDPGYYQPFYAGTAEFLVIAPTITSAALINGVWQLNGTAGPNSTVTIYDGATKLSPTTVADANGAWSFNATDNGAIRDFTATASDAYGSPSTPSPAFWEGTQGADTFAFASEAALAGAGGVFGNGGTDTLQITSAATLADGDFTHVHGIAALALTGASSVTLGVNAAAAGIATVVAGNGATSIADSNMGSLTVNAGAIPAGTSLSLSGSESFTVTGLKGNLTATAVTGSLNVTTVATPALTIATGAGSDTINASALTQGQTMTLTGNHAATVTVGGNLIASGYSGDLSVTASGTGKHTISTGSGKDTIIAAHGGDTINADGGGDTINVSGHTVADTYLYTALANSLNTSTGHDTITGFAAQTGKGAINDVLDFSALLGPRFNANTQFQTLNSASKNVNANTIAFYDNTTTHQTFVLVNSTGGALAQTSSQLMEVVLTGDIHLTASNIIG
jgi:hypothetical protein